MEREVDYAIASQSRQVLRDSDTLRILRALIRSADESGGKPVNLHDQDIEKIKALFEPEVKRAIRAHRNSYENLVTVFGALGPSFQRDPGPMPDKSVKLQLQVTQTHVPLAVFDPVKAAVIVDISVIRGIYIGALVSTYQTYDLPKAVQELTAVEALHRAGRTNAIDREKTPPELWEMSLDQRKVKLAEQDAVRMALTSRSPESVVSDYLSATDLILNMPIDAYHGEFQLDSGETIAPAATAWDLAGPIVLSKMQGQIKSVFLTLWLHEQGHAALGHGRLAITNIECEQRKDLELEAEAYASTLRTLARLDVTDPFEVILNPSLAFGGVEPTGAISDFFETTYRISRLGAGTSEANDAYAACYPTAEQRMFIANSLNLVFSEKVTKENLAEVSRCLEQWHARFERRDALALAIFGQVERDVDLTEVIEKCDKQ